jgi:putative endonuclease
MPKPSRLTRQQAETRGRRAETLAAIWLSLKGYRIIATRVRTPVGEIDLIAARGKTLAFIEVKRRKTLNSALQSVTSSNWHRISAAAASWTAKRTDFQHHDWRFDLVAITPRARPKHFPDYWRP